MKKNKLNSNTSEELFFSFNCSDFDLLSEELEPCKEGRCIIINNFLDDSQEVDPEAYIIQSMIVQKREKIETLYKLIKIEEQEMSQLQNHLAILIGDNDLWAATLLENIIDE